jgi:hypothetical protein
MSDVRNQISHSERSEESIVFEICALGFGSFFGVWTFGVCDLRGLKRRATESHVARYAGREALWPLVTCHLLLDTSLPARRIDAVLIRMGLVLIR